MFVPLWLFFLATGTLMALCTLLWATRTRQFDDQERARFLPLHDLDAPPLAAPARGRAVRLGLGLILASGALVIGSTLILVLRHL